MKKILILILLFLSIQNVNALKIVSLGDSIPDGYRLSDKSDSFDNMFAETLNSSFYEHSYIGMRSDDLLRDLDLKEVKENVKSADVVIINIGANDLLDLFDYVDLSEVGIVVEAGTTPKANLDIKTISILKEYLHNIFTNKLKPMSMKAATDFSITFPLIIEKVREYNPNAKIIVNNLYNPFFNISVPLLKIDLSDIEKICDEVITEFNSVINSHEGYEIIDIYSILRNNNYLNVNPLSLSFDPHPNIDGHKKIYELYINELCYKVTYDGKDYYVFKNSKAEIKPKYKFGYTFIKWNKDINKVNSDMEIEAIYRFNYLYIIIPVIIVMAVIIVIKKKH